MSGIYFVHRIRKGGYFNYSGLGSKLKVGRGGYTLSESLTIDKTIDKQKKKKKNMSMVKSNFAQKKVWGAPPPQPDAYANNLCTILVLFTQCFNLSIVDILVSV